MNSKESNDHIVAIIQARMGSTRLPGKTLMKIGEKSLLEHIVTRVRGSKLVDQVVFATTKGAEEAPILDQASVLEVPVYQGSADDVLDRFYQAARMSNADIIVRVTADDPFKDPEVIDLILNYLLAHPELDYVSNTIEPTFPEGLDIEAFRMSALKRAHQEAKKPSEREHVTPYVWKHPDRFNVHNLRHSEDLSHWRWTLDYDEDLQFAREVHSRLESKGVYLMKDILNLLAAEPDLAKINQGIARNLGYQLSLQKDNS